MLRRFLGRLLILALTALQRKYHTAFRSMLLSLRRAARLSVVDYLVGKRGRTLQDSDKATLNLSSNWLDKKVR